jgi:hypothetical protein
MIKAIAKKLTSKEVLDDNIFLSRYMLTVRSHCFLCAYLTSSQCKEFVRGDLDIKAHAGMIARPNILNVPKNAFLFVIDGLYYHFILKCINIKEHMDNYDDIRTLYGEQDDIKLYTGARIGLIVSSLYKDNWKDVLGTIIEEDGGIISRDGDVIHTKSYTFPSID